jgi:hypothetical protein
MNQKVKIIQKYSNEKPMVTFNYPNGDNKSSLAIKVFYENPNK